MTQQGAERIFEQGDKNWKLLALLTTDVKPQTVIPCLTSPFGDLITSREETLQTLVSYYSDLYSPIAPYSRGDLVAVLEPLRLPTLPEETCALLNAPLKEEEEVAGAIGCFTNHKAPDPDGLRVEWYKHYLELLSPTFLHLYHDCLPQGCLPPSFYDAHVVLIAKPNKDTLLCASYTPIPLFDMDLKNPYENTGT